MIQLQPMVQFHKRITFNDNEVYYNLSIRLHLPETKKIKKAVLGPILFLPNGDVELYQLVLNGLNIELNFTAKGILDSIIYGDLFTKYNDKQELIEITDNLGLYITTDDNKHPMQRINTVIIDNKTFQVKCIFDKYKHKIEYDKNIPITISIIRKDGE